MNLSRVFLFVIGIALVAACTKATLVGNELLENEKANLQYVEDLELRITTVQDDSVQTFPANLDRRRETLLCGKIEDPFFGTSESEIYSHLGLGFSSNSLNLFGAEIDSVVLFLEYDTLGLYGRDQVPVTIEVRQVREELNILTDYYANQSFEVDEMNVLGRLENHVPAPFDSIMVTNPDDTSLQVPHIRIPLDPEFLTALLADTVNLQNQDSLNQVFNGIRIKLSESNNSMLSFNPIGYSGVTVYHRINGETPSVYTFEFGFTTVSTMHQEHDYTGSIVEPFIGSPEKGDSLFFVQSMIGLNAQIEIVDPASLGNVLVNHAILELFAITMDNDDPGLYPTVTQLVTLENTEEGNVRYSDDVILPLSADLLDEVFGGLPSEPFESDNRIRKYEMIVTTQIQDIVNGSLDHLIVASFLKSNEANRVVFLGPNHPDYPPKLKVAATKVP
jgi:hypothetical protein